MRCAGVIWFSTVLSHEVPLLSARVLAGTKQPIHSFLEDKSLGIQQGTDVWVHWVDLPKSRVFPFCNWVSLEIVGKGAK